MRLTPEQVAEIRASEGIYRAVDVAKAYRVHHTTVGRIWAGEIRAGVQAAEEVPNINTRPRPVDLREDIDILLGRGMSVKETAHTLGISPTSVYMYRGVFI